MKKADDINEIFKRINESITKISDPKLRPRSIYVERGSGWGTVITLYDGETLEEYCKRNNFTF